MSSDYNKNSAGVNLEIKRNILAKEDAIVHLFKTYDGHKEIIDNNTESFWNVRNTDFKFGKSYDPMSWHRVNKVSGILEAANSHDILNVGYGTGNLESIYYKRNKIFPKWDAIDISQKYQNKVKNLTNGIVKRASVLRLPFKNNQYDTVVALEVLEHIKPSKIFLALKEIHRVLVLNGLFVVTVPINEGLEIMLKNNHNPNSHLRIYSKELLSKELEYTGFSVKHCEFLYAFHTHYRLKSFIAKHILTKYKPNNMVITAIKK